MTRGWRSGGAAKGRANSWIRALLLVVAVGLPAWAYIDPGTGSALVYIITGIVVSVYFAVRGLYYRLLEVVFRLRFKWQKCSLAIHSEDVRYETTFLPIMRALAERGVDATYFTMYERDESLEPLPPNITHRTIPPGLVGYAYLNHLEAKVLLTTTPQLDVMTFRRSRKVEHYCYVQHALGESRYVRPFAYDFFDTVFCCGPMLEESIRRIEGIRSAPPKRLLKTGVPHYDELLRRAADIPPIARPVTILIAPSWGPCSLFTNYGTGFVRAIAERWPVIVRPHPQMRVSQRDLYDDILATPGVTVDTEPTPSQAMASADILISDISGIVYEFTFLYKKPVMVVDQEVGVGGLEGFLLRDVPSMRERCSDFIRVLSPDEIPHLPDRIAEALQRHELPQRIAEARDEFVYNYGAAGRVAAGQLEEVLRCL